MAKQIVVGERVKPNGHTKDCLTYGYVRELLRNHRDEECALVYWPEIRSLGVWPINDLRS